MNESETRVELIDPTLAASGWGVDEDTRIHREFQITKGRIQPGGRRASQLKADYVLEYRGKKLAAIHRNGCRGSRPSNSSRTVRAKI